MGQGQDYQYRKVAFALIQASICGGLEVVAAVRVGIGILKLKLMV